MGSGDLAPDHADLGASDLLLALVDIRDLLAEVEAAPKMLDSFHIDIGSPMTYLAALVSSTPSILIKLVLGWVVCRLRW